MGLTLRGAMLALVKEDVNANAAALEDGGNLLCAG